MPGAASKIPLIYSCSGCSDVAQLANAIAVRLDRSGLAEMSCIAGVGGGVKPLVRKARSGRPIVAVDGCPLACCERVLELREVTPDRVVRLHELGLRKRLHADVDDAQREEVYGRVLAALSDLLSPAAAGARA